MATYVADGDRAELPDIDQGDAAAGCASGSPRGDWAAPAAEGMQASSGIGVAVADGVGNA